MSEEYDLKKSENKIGQLYPILVAKDGEIIDGIHREQADKNWTRLQLNHIDTEEKKLQARLIANFHRRIVPFIEKKKWINDLAKIYKDQGKKGIAQLIHETTGIRYDTALFYLEAEYKDHIATHVKLTREIEPASERFVTLVGTHRGNVAEAEKLVEEHREEVITEERPKIEQQVKKELLKSPDFQRAVLQEISKPKFVKPTEPCASGVCELPSTIEGGKAVDVIGERLVLFWQKNLKCLCKRCDHYETCGVIR